MPTLAASAMPTVDELVVFVITMALWLFLGSLISAWFLRVGAKWAEKLDVSYGTAFGTMLLAGVVNLGIGIAVGFAVGIVAAARNTPLEKFNYYLLIPINVLVLAMVIGKRHKLTMVKSLKITGVVCLMSLAIGVVVGLGVGAYLKIVGRS